MGLLFESAPPVAVQLVLAAVATWRLSVLLMREAGPWDILQRVRTWAGVTHDEDGEPYAWEGISAVLSCLWCTSMWVGAVVLLFPWQINALLTCSAAAIACNLMVERASKK